MNPIGILYSPMNETKHTHLPATRSQAAGYIEVFPEFAEGIRGFEGISRRISLYLFHCVDHYKLLVKPFLDDQLRALFAAYALYRPNPVGLSVVHSRPRRGNVLDIEGVDMLDRLPLLDI
jgi:tRNA-Thr(GGU) m(6)t(6)A37 methyltransferase TsaA